MTDSILGTVFDIQRCSMYDGPGIRTTVFLKGCPLSCKWCHNPESKCLTPQIAYYRDKCISCGKCVNACPNNAHWLSENNHEIEYNRCNLCGGCVINCPSQALKIMGKKMSADSVMDIVMQDTSYYKHTGGGLTISGGEPFLQFNFLLELLRCAKKNGIHTCVETSGYTSVDKIKAVAPYVDVFLYDYKETSDENHILFTGVSNKLILENFNWLYMNGYKIIMRCPIIPEYNDNDLHLLSICKMEKNYSNLLGIEIMPYHDLGKSKAGAIGADYSVTAKTYTQEQKNILKDRLRQFGGSERLIASFS